MELDRHGFLDELIGLKRKTWENFSIDMSEFFTDEGSFGCFLEHPRVVTPYSSLEGFATSSEKAFECSMSELCCPFEIEISEKHDAKATLVQEDSPSVTKDGSLSLNCTSLHNSEKQCTVELAKETEAQAFNIGLGGKNRVKKPVGQPSKNLMAERRRRKRLNDRLSMLRSVVPKMSKMDRTSILGDTIDYMKELLDRMRRMQEEIKVDANNQMNLLSLYEEQKPNEILASTPKFHVERRNMDTRIEICCAAKPGLLLSTVMTLETLGLGIQQCVISCFNNFGMQASCSERAIVRSEDIKKALFRNADHGGSCM